IYASPVLFSEDPALQISSNQASAPPDDMVLRKVRSLLTAEGLAIDVEQDSAGTITLRFENDEQRQRVKDLLKAELGDDFIVALSMAQNTPQWLQSLGAKPMNLGLDLRGGVHFLLEVDLSQALDPHLKSYASSMRSELR